MAKRKNSRTANSTPKLPHDVIEDVLVRLPVKSILRFSCVSKSWNQTIYSHHFSKTQLLFSKQQRMLFKDGLFGKLNHFSLESLWNQTTVDAIDVNSVYPFPKNVTWVGSCNGLVCLSLDMNLNLDLDFGSGTYIILWNPCTGKFNKLPEFELDVNSYVYSVYGFGYDKSRDDYKVVRLELSSKTGVVMYIYSLKAGSWKRIGNCEFRPETISGSSAFVNGKLYWTLEYGSEHAGIRLPYFRDADIGFLDVETEERGVVKKPDYVKSFYYPTNLVESEGCLYFYYGLLFRGEVWKIEGNGVGNMNWTKIAAISCDGDYVRRSIYRDCSRRNVYHRLLHVRKNGEMVLVCGPKLVIFNEKERSFSYLDIGHIEKFMAGTFVESMISPLI